MNKTLKSFVNYCLAHPQERFWQALRNFSNYPFIGYSLDGKTFKDLFYEKDLQQMSQKQKQY